MQTRGGLAPLSYPYGLIPSNFLVKVSDSPMTTIVIVFLVRTQYIDKDNYQKLVKLSYLSKEVFLERILTLKSCKMS